MAKTYYPRWRKLIDQSQRFIGTRQGKMLQRTGLSGAGLTEYQAWAAAVNAITNDPTNLPDYNEQP